MTSPKRVSFKGADGTPMYYFMYEPYAGRFVAALQQRGFADVAIEDVTDRQHTDRNLLEAERHRARVAEEEAATWKHTSDGWARRYNQAEEARQIADFQLCELFNALRLYIEMPNADEHDYARLCAIADQAELRDRAMATKTAFDARNTEALLAIAYAGDLELKIKDLERQLALAKGVCPMCGHSLTSAGRCEDCEALAKMTEEDYGY